MKQFKTIYLTLALIASTFISLQALAQLTPGRPGGGDRGNNGGCETRPEGCGNQGGDRDTPPRYEEPPRQHEPPRQTQPPRYEEPPRNTQPPRYEEPPRHNTPPPRNNQPPRYEEPPRHQNPPPRYNEPPRYGNCSFSETDYLAFNTDVQASVMRYEYTSGWQHFQSRGRYENRAFNRYCGPRANAIYCPFIEYEYLQYNQDVRRAIEQGYYYSGADHFSKRGYMQNRPLSRECARNMGISQPPTQPPVYPGDGGQYDNQIVKTVSINRSVYNESILLNRILGIDNRYAGYRIVAVLGSTTPNSSATTVAALLVNGQTQVTQRNPGRQISLYTNSNIVLRQNTELRLLIQGSTYINNLKVVLQRY